MLHCCAQVALQQCSDDDPRCSDDGGGRSADSDEEEEMSYREVWSSKASGGQTISPVAKAAELTGRAGASKRAGNDAFAAGRLLDCNSYGLPISKGLQQPNYLPCGGTGWQSMRAGNDAFAAGVSVM